MNGSRSEVRRLGLLSIWDGLDRSGELPPLRWVTHRGVDFQGHLGQMATDWVGGSNKSFFSPISGGFAPAIRSGQNKGSREMVQPPLAPGGSRQELACGSSHPFLAWDIFLKHYSLYISGQGSLFSL